MQLTWLIKPLAWKNRDKKYFVSALGGVGVCVCERERERERERMRNRGGERGGCSLFLNHILRVFSIKFVL